MGGGGGGGGGVETMIGLERAGEMEPNTILDYDKSRAFN